jgi:hypothetical protein
MTVPVPYEPCTICGRPKTYITGTWICLTCDAAAPQPPAVTFTCNRCGAQWHDITPRSSTCPHLIRRTDA